MNDNIPFDNDNREKRTYIGILRGIGYNINYIIGQNAFNPGNIWMLVQSPGITLVLYLICFFISLLGSSVYIELGIRSLPSGIGEQKYISDAFFPKRNFGHVFSFVAIFYSNRVSDFINQSLALFKIIGLLIISVVGLVKLRTNSFNWNNIFNLHSDFGAYGSGLIKANYIFHFGINIKGWNNINYLIGEFNPSSDNLVYPSRILKYSSLISVCISFISCCLTNAAFITVVGYNPNNSTYYESTPMPMRFGQELFGKAGENFMTTLVAISTFGSVSALIFTYSRIIKYAAETEFIPSLFNSYRAYFNTLFNQLWAQFLYCSILSIIFLIKMDYVADFLSNVSQYGYIIYHGASALCLIIIKIRLRNTNPRIFSVPIYMVITYLIIILVIIFALLDPPRNGKFNYLISYCISWVAVALGLIIWYIRNRGQCVQNQTIGETSNDEKA
ncbi:amino acid transporter [Gigaspora margarita]|uniref:Amino acid transporter n=1 Tax=Gigaspora margarita TaxID=4874 RepID=A0A8H4AXJ9_GIGMA|nr:amino acid transporter [Gigaspora margarita]